MNQVILNLTYIESVFHLEISNISKSLVKIWSSKFSSGYYSIYFKVTPLNENPFVIKRKLKRWTVNKREFVVIQPGDAYIQKLDLNDGTWDMTEVSVTSDTEIDINAILEILHDEDTTKYGVITGFYESNHLRFRSMSEIIKLKK